MQPHRAIYLQYDNFEEEHEKFIPVFKMLQNFDPGMGFKNGRPILLGFSKPSGTVYDLEQEVYDTFSGLKYQYDGKVPTAKFSIENPQIFSEFK